jgi:hypothetical protein
MLMEELDSRRSGPAVYVMNGFIHWVWGYGKCIRLGNRAGVEHATDHFDLCAASRISCHRKCSANMPSAEYCQLNVRTGVHGMKQEMR